jgi:outer membrane lipoprotein-sorting protein
MTPQAFDLTILGDFRAAEDYVQESRLVRRESINLDDTETVCDVIEMRSPHAVWWVDELTHHVVRVDEGDSSEVITHIKLNQPLPDDLFKFEPPQGARKLDFN